MNTEDKNRIVGWATLVLGLATASTPAWITTNAAGASLTLGLGALTAIYAMWSLLARNPAKDHWALSVVGFMLFLAPWVGGFAGDAASWVAWTAGVLIALLAGRAYVSDEADNIAETTRVNELVTYRLRQLQRREAADRARSSGVAV
ncbi:SPW repeat domain-containing protein [Nocardia sp. X0981]